MSAARNYSSVAQLAVLQATVSNSATSFPVDVTSGYPTPPFTIVIDGGLTAEEICTVTAIVGNTFTVARGQDGSPAQPHPAGAPIRHMATARDYREPAEHIGATSGVHGVSGTLVGATDVGILDNKTFTPTVTDHVPIILQQATSQATHLMDFRNSSNTVLGFVDNAGQVNTPSVIGTNTSTFTAGLTTSVALIAQAAAGQAVSILSVRDASGIEQVAVSATGTLRAGNAVIAANLASATPLLLSGYVAQTANVFEIRDSANNLQLLTLSTGQTISTTLLTTAVPLVARVPAASTVSAFAVRDNETSTSQAGFLGGASGWQLYHGGATTNRVPLRIHGGSVNVTMTNGSTSVGGSIDISSYGFGFPPIITLTVKQNADTDTVRRRVAVNISGSSTSEIDFRVVQTSNEVMSQDTVYAVHWIAYQFTPTTAAG